jgi:hypothetical protein
MSTGIRSKIIPAMGLVDPNLAFVMEGEESLL